MTTKDTSIEYLKAIQRNALIGRFGLNYESELLKINAYPLWDSFVDEYIVGKDEIDEDRKVEMEAGLKGRFFESKLLNTGLEIKIENHILSNSIELYQQLNPDTKINVNVYFGTTVNTEIEAVTDYYKEADSHFILFSTEQFNVILQLSKLLTETLPLKRTYPYLSSKITKKDLIDKIKVLNDIINYQIYSTLYYSIFEIPTRASRHAIKDDYKEHFCTRLIEAIELFILSHEISHYLNGDNLSKTQLVEVQSNDVLPQEWQQELKADYHAINQIAKLYILDNKNMTVLLAPEMFFHFEALRENYTTGEIDQSHPTADMRLIAYRMSLANFIPLKDLEEYFNLQKILELLFDYYKSVLETALKFNKKNESSNHIINK